MTSIAVREQSQVAQTRRLAAALATTLGGGESAVGNVAIVATELATNIVRHTDGGEIIFRPWNDGEGSGLELLALDKGRGMADVAACLQDGYSTAGTAGQGLGAISRIAATLDVWTQPGKGSVLAARIRLHNAAPHPATHFVWSAISVPVAGEEECGDAWSATGEAARGRFLVVDGLGHGSMAARAAQSATKVFEERAMRETPGPVLQTMHRALASTRGAAAAIAEWHAYDNNLVFSGLGNIAGTLLSGGGTRKMVSHSGTLGHVARTVREFTYPAPPDTVLIMHSDGLLTNWSLDDYPGLLSHHPAVIAGIMYRDFKRGRDDATVLVAKRKP